MVSWAVLSRVEFSQAPRCSSRGRKRAVCLREPVGNRSKNKGFDVRSRRIDKIAILAHAIHTHVNATRRWQSRGFKTVTMSPFGRSPHTFSMPGVEGPLQGSERDCSESWHF